MPRFGRGRGMGMGMGRGMGMGMGRGMGMGNPYPYCRFYPWLPRRWWAMGVSPYSAPSPGDMPYTPYTAWPAPGPVAGW